MSTPIIESILDDLGTALEAITVANGYNYSPTIHKRRPLDLARVGKFPCVFFWREPEDAGEINSGYIDKEAPITIGVMTDDGDDPAQTIEQLMADVEKAVMADHTRGGYAINTVLEKTETEFPGEGRRPSGVGYLDFTIMYRHKRGDPYQ